MALNNYSIRVFDIRKNLKVPLKQLKQRCTRIACNDTNLAIGCRNGFVKLFDEKFEMVKTFSNLTTVVDDLSMNDEFLSFSTKWKMNGIRLVNLKDYKVVQ